CLIDVSAAGALLVGTSAGENTLEGEVSLMTRVFVDLLLALLHGNYRSPRLRPDGRIVDREFVLKHTCRDAGEAFHDMQPPAGASEVDQRRQIGGLDNKRVAVPVPTRVASPLAEVLAEVCASVEWNDAVFMDHLVDNRHVSRSLEDLNIVVVRA